MTNVLFLRSSQLGAVNTHIPILDGANYREWKPQMKAFLQASGLWRIVDGTTTRPAAAGPDQTAWDMSDDMAQGNLTLRMSHNIRNQVGADSAAIWTNLKF